MDWTQKLLLMQINDAVFPIGGYSHSYGLETYVSKQMVTDSQTAGAYIEKKFRYGFLYGDLLPARLAWEYGQQKDWEQINKLQEYVEAGKIPKEARDASHKLGSRFANTVEKMDVCSPKDCLYVKYVNAYGKNVHHAVCYGLFCQASGIAEEEMLGFFCYSQLSAMTVNCVKMIPLSQSEGQKILYHSCRQIEAVMEKVQTLELHQVCQSAPGFDIRSMQHERLYSRLYMS